MTITNQQACDKLGVKELFITYSYGLMSAVYKYMGSYIGCENVADCNEDVKNTAMRVLHELEDVFCAVYDCSDEDIQLWKKEVVADNELLKAKTKDIYDNLTDSIKKDNLLVSAAILCKNNGILPTEITKIIAYACLFDNSSDNSAEILREYIEYYGLKSALKKYCQLDQEPELQQLIVDQYNGICDNKMQSIERLEILKKAFNLGFINEKKYGGCAQCTLLTMFNLFGHENKGLFQSASALAGGMALTGDGACGGYTGGIMYMGSIIGRRIDRLDDGDAEFKTASYRMAQNLRDKFIETYGSIICADIHSEIFGRSFCLRTKAVKNDFEKAGAHTSKCTTVIGMASMWIAEILYDEGYIK